MSMLPNWLVGGQHHTIVQGACLSDLRMPGAKDVGDNETRGHSVKRCGTSNGCVDTGLDAVVDFGSQSIDGTCHWLTWRVHKAVLPLHARCMIFVGNCR